MDRKQARTSLMDRELAVSFLSISEMTNKLERTHIITSQNQDRIRTNERTERNHRLCGVYFISLGSIFALDYVVVKHMKYLVHIRGILTFKKPHRRITIQSNNATQNEAYTYS